MIKIKNSKIFNLSLQKNGTKSFHLFCKNKKIKSLHWLPENPLNFEQYSSNHFEELEQVSKFCLENQTIEPCYSYYKSNFFQTYDSFCDFPIPLFYEKLMEEYSNETFLLFYRDTNDWIKSVRKHYSTGDNNNYFDLLMYYQLSGKKKTNINDYSDCELAEIYKNHFFNVCKCSMNHMINLHIINLNFESSSLLNNIIKTSSDSLFGKYS
jgi:hypothetical protein